MPILHQKSVHGSHLRQYAMLFEIYSRELHESDVHIITFWVQVLLYYLLHVSLQP